MKRTIKVNYYNYRTGKLIKTFTRESTSYNSVMVSLLTIDHKCIIGNSCDEIDIYI